MGHDRTGADNRTSSDVNTAHHYRARPNPGIVVNGYWLRRKVDVFGMTFGKDRTNVSVAFSRINRMSQIVKNGHVVCDKGAITD